MTEIAPGSDAPASGESPSRRNAVIAAVAAGGLVVHLGLRYGMQWHPSLPMGVELDQLPLLMTLAAGGLPLVIELLIKLAHADFGSDLLAGISIVVSALLGEYLAGAMV